MQFEGTQVNIPIKGIMRAGTDNLSADGAMNEVIGMEYKDGSWLPYAVKSERDNIIVGNHSFIKSYIHKISDNTSNTLYLDSNRVLFFPDLENSDEENPASLGEPIVTDVRDVAFVGNVMCVATDRGIEYYICEDGEYYQVQTGYYPHVDLRVTSGLYDKEQTAEEEGELIGVRHVASIMGENLRYSSNNKDTFISDNTRSSKISGGLTAAKGEVRDRGGLTGYVLACVAYRNTHGDIIAADAPVLLSRPHSLLEGNILNLGTEDGKFYHRVYNEDLQQWETIPFTEEEMKSFPIIQEPLSNEVDWDRTATDMTENGIVKLRKKDYGTLDTQGNYYGGTWTDKLESAQYLYEYKYRYLYAATRTEPVSHAPEEDLSDYRTWREQRAADRDVYTPEEQRPLPYPLFCTEMESMMRGGDTTTGQIQRDYTFFTFAAANTLQYKIPSISVEERKELYSVCIFISPEISAYKMSEKIDDVMGDVDISGKSILYLYSGTEGGQARNDSTIATTYYPKLRGNDSIIEDIKNVKSLYLVKEIRIDDITPSDEWVSVDLKGLLGDTLLTRESLPITAFNRDKYYPNMLDTYNLRLHMYDYTTELFEGHKVPSFAHHGGEYQYPKSYFITGGVSWEAMVEIEDGNGESHVVTYDSTMAQHFVKSMSPIITYPNKYAKSITIRLYHYYNSVMDTYEVEFTLSRHEGLGISYYIDPELKPILPQILQQANG